MQEDQMCLHKVGERVVADTSPRATHRHRNALAFLPPHTWVNDGLQLFHLIVVYTA